MENASNALMMAGGVLISLIIIGILVFFFNNLQELKGIELTAEQVEQATEFNKQYDVYARNIYGSEILSLANKIDDYNKRESEEKGYSRIDIEIKINQSFDNQYFIAKTYSASEIRSEVKKLENQTDKLGKISIVAAIGSRKISQLANMRTTEIEALGINLNKTISIPINNQNKSVTVQTAINTYNSLKSLLTQVKESVFKYKPFEYDQNTGRIIKMKYEI